VDGMSFFLSGWFWFARRARRRATARSEAQAGRFAIGVQRSETESASRGRNEHREAQRVSAEWFARGCSRSALCRDGRRRHERSLQGGAMPTASVQAFQRDAVDR